VSKLTQGITTEITGNCGASAAPRFGGYEMPSDWRQQRYPREWRSVAEYRELLAECRPAIHSRMLCGHRNLRAAVMGTAPRAATADEVREMVRLLDQALDEGAAGVSTGLVYAPAMFAERDELLALCRSAARRGGLYATHMRSESARLLEAVDEALDLARSTGVRLQISHLKTSGRRNWHKIDALLEKLRQARTNGTDVASDRYPYTASGTDLDIILPEWAEQDGREAILARVRDPATRARILGEWAGSRSDEDWETVWIGCTRAPENAAFTGRPLREAAEAWGLSCAEAALRFMDTDDLYTGGFFFGMNEDNMRRILSEPWIMVGSDASLRAPTGPLAADHPHPRAYGTMARYFRLALDELGLTPGETVRKVTSLPAERFRLAGRGVLRAGNWADVTVLDPAAFRNTATYGKPHSFCTGLDAVFVNGRAALLGGKQTEERAGTYLD
jgi:N-acyl-D-amino-acid deacylase